MSIQILSKIRIFFNSYIYSKGIAKKNGVKERQKMKIGLLNQIIQQTTAVGATALPVSFPLSGNFENRPTGLSQSNVDCSNHFGFCLCSTKSGFFTCLLNQH